MGWLIAAGAVVAYFAGSLITYRVTYIRRTEKHFLSRTKCSSCKRNLGDHIRGWSSPVACDDHIEKLKDLKEQTFLIAMFWPFCLFSLGTKYTGIGIAKAVKKMVFPSGPAKTPSKLAWEVMVQEAKIERNQKILDKQEEEMRDRDGARTTY